MGARIASAISATLLPQNLRPAPIIMLAAHPQRRGLGLPERSLSTAPCPTTLAKQSQPPSHFAPGCVSGHNAASILLQRPLLPALSSVAGANTRLIFIKGLLRLNFGFSRPPVDRQKSYVVLTVRSSQFISIHFGAASRRICGSGLSTSICGRNASNWKPCLPEPDLAVELG